MAQFGDFSWEASSDSDTCAMSFRIDVPPVGWIAGDEVDNPFQQAIIGIAQRSGELGESLALRAFGPDFGSDAPIIVVSFGIGLLPEEVEVGRISIAGIEAIRLPIPDSESSLFYFESAATAEVIDLLESVDSVAITAETKTGEEFSSNLATPMFENAKAMFNACVAAAGEAPSSAAATEEESPSWGAAAHQSGCVMYSRGPRVEGPNWAPSLRIYYDIETPAYEPSYLDNPDFAANEPAFVANFYFLAVPVELRPQFRAVSIEGIELQPLPGFSSLEDERAYGVSGDAGRAIITILEQSDSPSILISLGEADSLELPLDTQHFFVAHSMFRACVNGLSNEPVSSFEYVSSRMRQRGAP